MMGVSTVLPIVGLFFQHLLEVPSLSGIFEELHFMLEAMQEEIV